MVKSYEIRESYYRYYGIDKILYHKKIGSAYGMVYVPKPEE